MPDVSGIPALDVIIGLIFVYFVLSIVCSAFNELIAAALNLRARNLKSAVANLLGDERLVDAFYDDPRVNALMKPRLLLGRRRPSYIPPRLFALAVLGARAPNDGDDVSAYLARAGGLLRKLPANSPVHAALADAFAAGRMSHDALRAAVEQMFDDVMERAQGWYKRRVQLILVCIAALFVGAANADSFTIAERLWKDDSLRAAVVAQATAQPSATDCEDTSNDGAKAGAKGAAKTDAQDQSPLARTAACLDAIDELGIPLGWSDDTTPARADGWGIVGKFFGLLVTVGAVSLGAPFWFDLLGRVSSLRGAGRRAATAEDESAAKSKREAAAADK